MSAVHLEPAPVAQPADPDKLNAFLGRMVGDLGAIASGALVLLGDRLGLFRAMRVGRADDTRRPRRSAPAPTSATCASGSSAQAAAGYVDYDDAAGTFHLNPEQAAVFADDDSPASMAGAFEVLSACGSTSRRSPKRSATGAAWAGTSTATACSAAPSGSSGPATTPTSCRRGCPRSTAWSTSCSAAPRVADVGCGHGASTIVMARAFPNSQFVGFDYHAPSVRGRHASGARRRRRATCASRSRTPRTSPAASTWWRSSTACTTWATRSAPPRTCARRSSPTAPG